MIRDMDIWQYMNYDIDELKEKMEVHNVSKGLV
jgi:hypothetical protein